MHVRVLAMATLALTVAQPVFCFQNQRRREELASGYKKWLTEDAAYILSDEERQTWTRLSTDDEREQFVEQFWIRRDPTPDTEENEFKEEHYRRIAYANERFASGIPGWKTDRGRMYIKFGPPDEIESHPSGSSYQRLPEEGIALSFPFEKWRYRWIEGIGSDVVMEFVDQTMTGEYRMVMDPSEQEALLMAPGGRPDRFTSLRQYTDLNKPLTVKFKDLQASIDSTIKFNSLPMQVHADFFPLTESSILSNLTVQLENKDLQFQAIDGAQRAVVNIHGRISSLTHRTVNIFEEQIVVDSPLSARSSIFQKSLPLLPGVYRLNLTIQDAIGGTRDNFEMALNVPRFESDKLTASSLVLADLIEKVPTRSIGTGQFVIGATKVRPRVSSVFQRFEKLGIYISAYNFKPSERSSKPSGMVEYEIYRSGSNEKILEFSEDIAAMPNASTRQVTIEKVLPLTNLEPGKYTLKMRITDSNSSETLTPIAVFTVN